MITRLTQRFAVSCDRCGKVEYCDETKPLRWELVVFKKDEMALVEPIRKGLVCDDCYKDFCELAENFFDAANKEIEDKPKKKKKPDAIYIGYSSHDCEAHYRCPLCGDSFGTWSINMKYVRCPNCKEELGGIR